MGLLVQLDRSPLQAATPGPLNDYWYQPVGPASATGLSISPDTALTIAAVFSAVRVLAETVAQLPLPLYERMADGGKERAGDHQLYTILHDQPNRWQTAVDFWEMMMGHLVLRGNAYAYILRERGEVSELIPLHPDRMKVEQLANLKLRYRYREAAGTETIYLQDEIFHLRGLSSNGITGLSVVSLARNSFGLAMATEGYGASFFGPLSGRVDGVLKTSEKLTPEIAERVAHSWTERRRGNPHGIAVLEQGLEYQAMGITSEEAQFLETRNFQISEIARWFRLPLHMLAALDQSTNNNIEEQALEFVIYTMMPWLKRIEQAIRRDLIDDPVTYFAEFLIDGLLRGNTKSRYESYAIALQNRWMTGNEVREKENLNKLPGLDELPPIPLNMANPGGTPQPNKATAMRSRLIAYEAAGRIVRKEIAAIGKQARKLADSPEQWESWLRAFYVDHADEVARSLRLDPKTATEYCDKQCGDVLTRGVAVIETWEEHVIPELGDLALGGEEETEGGGQPPMPNAEIITITRDANGDMVRVVKETA